MTERRSAAAVRHAKQGVSDIRRNLVLAGHSLLTMVKRRKEPPSDRLLIWVRRLGQRKNRTVAAVRRGRQTRPMLAARTYGHQQTGYMTVQANIVLASGERSIRDRPFGIFHKFYCGPPRIEAGWPGNLRRCPVSVSVVPSTFRIERSASMKLPT
jgi:hypothetical protein